MSLFTYLESCRARVSAVLDDNYDSDERCAEFMENAIEDQQRLIQIVECLMRIQKKVDEQAEDEGLWSVPWEGLQPVAEAHLQQELRALHLVIETALAQADKLAAGVLE